ncbi:MULTISPECIES: hypothetical protein [Rhodopirellula]|nr:hypothetical protein [Rhodopirellula sp. UBA1907]
MQLRRRLCVRVVGRLGGIIESGQLASQDRDFAWCVDRKYDSSTA